MLLATLVIFIGYDYQRTLDGIHFWISRGVGIGKVYLIYNRRKDKFGIASLRNMKDIKNELGIFKPECIGVDPLDYEEVFKTLYRILKKEVDENNQEVWVDPSATAEEAFAATITIALMFKGTKIYIVPPEVRGPTIPEFERREEYDKWYADIRSRRGSTPREIYLPPHRLSRPLGEEEEVLLKLEEHGGSAPSLLDLIKWCKGSFEPQSALKAKYSRLIGRLEELGFVRTERLTKTREVRLTDFGKIYAKAAKAS